MAKSEGKEQDVEVAKLVIRARIVEQRIAAGVKIAVSIAHVGGCIGVSFFVMKTAEAFAGKTTLANLGVAFIANVDFSKWAAWLLASLTSGGMYLQRRTNKALIARNADLSKKLEIPLSPNRSSSDLQRDGRPKKRYSQELCSARDDQAAIPSTNLRPASSWTSCA